MEVINRKMHNDQRVIILPEGKKWDAILKESLRPELESLLPAYLQRSRWFGGKAKTITEARIIDAPALPGRGTKAYLLTVAVSYQDAPDERYLLPLSHGAGEAARRINRIFPSAILTRIHTGPEKGILYDSSCDPFFMENCFYFIARDEKTGETTGRLRGMPGKSLMEWIKEGESLPKPELLGKEQSNTSFLYGNKFIFKLYRRVVAGIHPEVEMTRFLTEEAGFSHIAPFAGLIGLSSPGSTDTAIGLLQSYVEHRDDAWNYSLGAAINYLEGIPAGERYQQDIRLLGKRTAELHQALASAPADLDFAPAPFSPSDRETLCRSVSLLIEETFRTLREVEDTLPPETRSEAGRILSGKSAILSRLRKIEEGALSGMKIRIHGDYHLGQLLYTGDDFVIIDFEGEPARTTAERRRKRSPLVDVAGMIRSFHYAAYGALFLCSDHDPDRISSLFPRAESWSRTMSGIFFRSYLETMAGGAVILPESRKELARLLEIFILEKAVYELNYELNNRPDWVMIPLRGIKLNGYQSF